MLTWEILYALSSVSRICITVSGYLQCVTVVIPGSETRMPNQSFVSEFYLLLFVNNWVKDECTFVIHMVSVLSMTEYY